MNERIKYVNPRYVCEGDRVLIAWPTQANPSQGLWTRVAVACGDAARVVNENFHVDSWKRLDQLYVPADSERA